MREFKIRFVEDHKRDTVCVECDFGVPDGATDQENHRAKIAQVLISAVLIKGMPKIGGVGMADERADALAQANIQVDIKKAGEPP